MTDFQSSAPRRVIVTGAARGLGLAMSVALLNAGHTVLLVDKDKREIENVLEQSVLAGAGRACGICVDLTQPGSVEVVMQAALADMGGVDVLINNAGVGPGLVRKDYFQNPPSFVDLEEGIVRLFFEINAIAPMLLSIHAARLMRDQKWGRIINITTSNDSMMKKGFAPYGGTKAALESHSAIMAQDLEGTGITLNVLVPGGPADTDMIPQESGFERAQLVRPEAMVAPLMWLLDDDGNTPNGKRVLAALWSRLAIGREHPSVAPIGWPGVGSEAILPVSKL